MGNLNPKPVEIEFNGKTYGVTFTLNLIDEVQTYFDKPLSDVFNLIIDSPQSVSNLRYMLTLLLNDAPEAESELTQEEVGKKIDIRSFDYYYRKVIEALGISLPDGDEEDDPNSEGKQLPSA